MSSRYTFDLDRLFADIRAKRVEKGYRLKERQLAKKLGVSASLVNGYFGGFNRPAPKDVKLETGIQMMLWLGTTDFRRYLKVVED